MGCSRLLVWLMITTTSVGGFSHFCGMTSYNLDKQICCGEKLSNLTQDGQVVECCTTSGRTYKPGSELCCGDVYNKTDFEKQNFSCCNGKPIKKVGEICCGGIIISTEGGRGCCGNKSYALRRGRCCKDKLYHMKDFKGRCCGSETYDNRTHQCHRTNSFVGALPINLQRCGTTNINTGTHTCCNEDTPVDITGYRGEFPPVCCNNTIIPDKKAFRCYLDRILPINQSLCKKTDNGELYIPYNHNDQWCCNGNVVQKNSTSGRRETCCGSGVIDLSTQRCCAGRHPYIDFKQHCCGDTVVDSKEMCCGTAVLTEEQVCCNESNKIFPVQKQSEFDDGCCNGKPYQRAHTCTDRTPTCGKQPFNTSEDKCCINNLHKGANGPDIECCGASIRNITYQDCRYGRPKNKTVTNPSNRYRKPHLCGKTNIRVRKRKDQCCDNRFYKNAKRNGLRCCGSEVYDYNTLKCCSGKPVPLNSASCKRRRRRHKHKRSKSLRCSLPAWVRRKYLKKIACIQHAYVMKKEFNGHDYRTKEDLALKKRKGRTTAWNATPFCKHVLSHRHFILITNPFGNYTLRYSKKYLIKVRNLIKEVPQCNFS